MAQRSSPLRANIGISPLPHFTIHFGGAELLVPVQSLLVRPKLQVHRLIEESCLLCVWVECVWVHIEFVIVRAKNRKYLSSAAVFDESSLRKFVRVRISIQHAVNSGHF